MFGRSDGVEKILRPIRTICTRRVRERRFAEKTRRRELAFDVEGD